MQLTQVHSKENNTKTIWSSPAISTLIAISTAATALIKTSTTNIKRNYL